MLFSKSLTIAACLFGASHNSVYAKEAPACAPSEFYGSTQVTDLCKDYFPDKASDNVWMIEFYAPWCPHCKDLSPAYIQAAKQVKKNKEEGVKFGAVDCTKEKYLCQKYMITGYPTIKTMVDGKVKAYEGSREADGMVKHLLSLRSKRSTKGGSSKCSSSLADSDKKDVVALCASHFPNSTGKNSWVILFHNGTPANGVSQVKELTTKLAGIRGVKVGAVDCAADSAFCGKHVDEAPSAGSVVVKTYKKGAKKVSKNSHTAGLEDVKAVVDFAKAELGISSHDEL